ncbi:MAG: hypothetical protein JZU63_11395, partial [Rhodoferax sp.]|nr:hypothetical protein [Rhodoferax sp.]
HFDAKKDGRGAVLALKRQCEGESANMTIKAKAYAKLGASQFTGHRRNWTFQHYVQAHQEAHAELELVGEAVPETKKVQDDGSIDHLVVLVDNHLSGLIGEETGM